MIVVSDGNDGFTLPAAEDVGRLSTLGTTRYDSSRRSEKKGTSAITFGNACNILRLDLSYARLLSDHNLTTTDLYINPYSVSAKDSAFIQYWYMMLNILQAIGKAAAAHLVHFLSRANRPAI
jgi:hypothetical protein